MTREWKPGDVALVRNEYGVWNVAICALSSVRGTFWRYGVADSGIDLDAEAHPLVIIDPEDAEQVGALSQAYHSTKHSGDLPEQAMTVTELKMRAALLSLITPPKPEEPTGLGAVVEDVEGRRWVRLDIESSPWHLMPPGPLGINANTYADVDAVKVLSEGVTP